MNNLINLFSKNSVALSSLESPEHAQRKDPKIISVNWFIGKRCNYDCSYCSSYIHDNFSPHIKKEYAMQFVKNLNDYGKQQRKKIKLAYTGGEPFVHPDFLNILKYTKNNCEQIDKIIVTSNGSLPIKLYIESLKYLTHLTISLHLEESENVLNDTIEKIIFLTKNNNGVFITTNLMAVPTKFDMIEKFIKVFEKNDVNYTLLKINPRDADHDIHGKKSDLNKKIPILKDYRNVKKEQTINLEEKYKNYYSKEEDEYLKTFNYGKKIWNDIRLYDKNNNYQDTNTEILKFKNLNKWKGWTCYIGIDSLYIHHDGSVFGGFCMQGKNLGNIKDKIIFLSNPTICPLESCNCTTDMTVRKYKNEIGKIFIND